ncbi:unnamed protein product [Pedinophyceae sp. YPF-701]|nr:unnamed protein product [Pedinophyceae sp. YPF-701]
MGNCLATASMPGGKPRCEHCKHTAAVAWTAMTDAQRMIWVRLSDTGFAHRVCQTKVSVTTEASTRRLGVTRDTAASADAPSVRATPRPPERDRLRAGSAATQACASGHSGLGVCGCDERAPDGAVALSRDDSLSKAKSVPPKRTGLTPAQIEGLQCRRMFGLGNARPPALLQIPEDSKWRVNYWEISRYRKNPRIEQLCGAAARSAHSRKEFERRKHTSDRPAGAPASPPNTPVARPAPQQQQRALTTVTSAPVVRRDAPSAGQAHPPADQAAPQRGSSHPGGEVGARQTVGVRAEPAAREDPCPSPGSSVENDSGLGAAGGGKHSSGTHAHDVGGADEEGGVWRPLPLEDSSPTMPRDHEAAATDVRVVAAASQHTAQVA